MDKKVIGVFQSEEEVRKAVENLKVDGFSPDEISIVAYESEDISWVREKTGVKEDTNKQHSSTDEDNNESFWHKIKAAFVSDGLDGSHSNAYVNHFKELGLSEEEAKDYDGVVRNGKIVVVATQSETGTVYDAETRNYDNNISGGSARSIGTHPPIEQETRKDSDTIINKSFFNKDDDRKL